MYDLSYKAEQGWSQTNPQQQWSWSFKFVSIWSGRLMLWDSFSCVHTDLLSVASGSFWTISCILLHTVLRRKMPTCNNMHFVLNQGNMVMNVYDSSLSWSKNLNGYKSEVTLFSTSQLNLMSSCWAQHTIKGWF